MSEEQRVVAFTPYGREVTVTILAAYMEREHDRGIIDEWQLWMNTEPKGQERDVEYAHELADYHCDWITLKEQPEGVPRATPKQLNTGSFYRYTTDPNTVYLRFDDDIVYVHEDAVEKMVAAKVAQRTALGVFPIIWNNAICSWHLQQRGIIPMDFGVVQDDYCMDKMGWANAAFAIKLHELLLSKAELGDDAVKSLFMYQDVQLKPAQQFSVSCFAVHGRDYAALEPPGALDYGEEEHWLTVHRPSATGQYNVILGDALVSHLTFYPQRTLLKSKPAILERYRGLAMAVESQRHVRQGDKWQAERAEQWAGAKV